MWNPRMGGEKSLSTSASIRRLGSPPRRRGKGVRSGVHRCCRWITPAQAGKSLGLVRVTLRDRDHPRVGGEKPASAKAASYAQGSPPHGRGKDEDCPVAEPLEGITPAWAGKSDTTRPATRSRRDHPRVGGEKARDRASVVMVKGSPPRGRGKDSFIVHCHACVGITPAWAGKRAARGESSSSSWDYPRVGGEKLDTLKSSGAPGGSPPHRRGKVEQFHTKPLHHGITPA